MKCKCENVHSLTDLCESCRLDYERWLNDSNLILVRDVPRAMTNEEFEVFRGSRVASPQGQAIRDYFNSMKVNKGE